MIAFGKDGNAYLANRNNLGGIGGQIQMIPGGERLDPHRARGL